MTGQRVVYCHTVPSNLTASRMSEQMTHIHWVLYINKCTNCIYLLLFLLLLLLLLLLLILLLQSALQPLWVLVCSAIVEYSQQEGFYRVPLPAARQTPNLEDQWLERSNSRHQVSPTSETTRANRSSERWNYGQEIAENFAESGDLIVYLILI